MSERIFFLIVICLGVTRQHDAARILGVMATPAYSHYNLGSTLMKALAEDGHDITVITAFSEKNPPKHGSWREIFLDEIVEEQKKRMGKMSMLDQNSINPFIAPVFTNTLGNVEMILSNLKVQKLLKSKEKFDVVIVTEFFNDALNSFAQHFDAHLVLLSTLSANVWNNHLVGNPSLPSFYPEVLMNYPLKMSFIQRVKNTLLRLVLDLNLHLIFYPKQDQMIKKYVSQFIDIGDVLANVSLVLLNSHVSVSHPHPHVPNMIEIGGFHVLPPKKLPAELQKFLDDATEGVIYFSMGSNLKSKNLPVDMRDAILKAFSKRKEKVLWKWEEDSLPGHPRNVHLSKWLPQNDLLAHPNIKVFITHGGHLSTTEAVYHGVPIIAIPVFGDQQSNADCAQRAGFGLVMQLREISEEKLSSFLDQIINNPKYTENVKTRSKILKDRVMKPLDEAVHWVNYIIRHNGAPHLRVHYLHLNWYQYYCLDVFVFLFGTILAACLLVRKLWTTLCRRKQIPQKIKSQ